MTALSSHIGSGPAVRVASSRLGAMEQEESDQFFMAPERSLMQRSKVVLLDHVRRCPCAEKTAGKPKSKFGIGVRHRAVDGPHAHRVPGGRFNVGPGTKQHLKQFLSTKEAGVAQRMKPIGGILAHGFRVAREQLTNAVKVADRAGLEQVQVIAAGSENSGDLFLAGVDRKAHHRDSVRIPAARETGICADRTTNGVHVPSTDRDDEVACIHVHSPLSSNKKSTGPRIPD